ncbi:hypothetical protein SADUNF_Sadunf02G0064200 [Salix dunnii]|uniref:Uncharacterized protein n=1 Tax=Salix dunnii TaxID=1413687 RepID=A0A835TIV5_9ROSI|nr:hypothetical protein SADUNF_Sadunf02G0064200 [Salix dunnii]
MVGKHPWTNVESNYEETEYLLSKQIDASGHGKSGESSSGHHLEANFCPPRLDPLHGHRNWRQIRYKSDVASFISQ